MTTSRTIKLTGCAQGQSDFDGDASGECSFDGSKNIVVTLSIPKVESAANAENATYAEQSGAATAAAKAVIADTATNATTAEKLKTARKIRFTGAVEGEVTVDWSGDIIINLTATDDSLITDKISNEDIDAMF